jgi:hydrogenase maturation factor
MGRAAREAGVAIVTGDTKVVERGKGDGVFITTTGSLDSFRRASISRATGRGPATA